MYAFSIKNFAILLGISFVFLACGNTRDKIYPSYPNTPPATHAKSYIQPSRHTKKAYVPSSTRAKTYVYPSTYTNSAPAFTSSSTHMEDNARAYAAHNNKAFYPPYAKPGRCYTKVNMPAKYKNVTDRILLSPQKYSYLSIPAVYTRVQRKVLVSPTKNIWESSKNTLCHTNREHKKVYCLKQIPAVYKTVTKRVMTTPKRTIKQVIPAQYTNVTKRVKTYEGRIAWKEVGCQKEYLPR